MGASYHAILKEYMVDVSNCKYRLQTPVGHTLAHLDTRPIKGFVLPRR